MKVVVVTYGRETSEEVERDLDRIAEVLREIGDADKLFGRDELENISGSREIAMLNTSEGRRPFLSTDIKNEKPDILLTYDLAGFELTTLTDGLSYNLIDCRQLHVIKNEIPVNKNMLNKIMSINMFFFTNNEELRDRYMAEYATIPYIETLK